MTLEKALAIDGAKMILIKSGCKIVSLGCLVLRTSKKTDQRFIAVHSRKVQSNVGDCPQAYMSFHSRRDLCKARSYGDDKILKVIEVER